MAEEPVLKYETRENGRIVIMTMNRPERMNALGGGLSQAIAEGWERFAADDNAWVAIITGAGDRAFCAGADLKETSEIRQGLRQTVPSRRQHWAYPLSEGLNLWKPTIAAINGYAIAGGWMVAQQCDVRIAAEHAEMGIAEARWNMGAGWIHDLTRQLHLQHALELVIWADARITAQRAYEIGWVNKVVPKERLMDEALAWAERVLYLAPRAARNFKEILYRGYYMTPEMGRAFARALEQNLVGMQDSIEGPKAFAEKRKPVFQNR
ncbi:MAG: enoyl-CoA hydratase/isomerase family protein [Chloroflexi bacterium]|nr:enoyl-CoA hydratase/isomerase family protein [Chloroflexota bacterium]